MSRRFDFKRRVCAMLAAAFIAVGVPRLGSSERRERFPSSRPASPPRPRSTTDDGGRRDRGHHGLGHRRLLASWPVDVEIYDRSGNKVFQQYWDNQSFKAGQARRLSTSWDTTGHAAGTYTVKVGVFRTGWRSLIHWNNAAATIAVTNAPPVTTAPPTTTVPRPADHDRPTTTTDHDAPPTTTAPPTTPPSSGRFATLPVGAALPSGAQCAALVRPAAEIRPENNAANAIRGSRANANTCTDWSGFNRVDGDFTGTTDEIIQWAACKWGIDEDIAGRR